MPSTHDATSLPPLISIFFSNDAGNGSPDSINVTVRWSPVNNGNPFGNQSYITDILYSINNGTQQTATVTNVISNSTIVKSYATITGCNYCDIVSGIFLVNAAGQTEQYTSYTVNKSFVRSTEDTCSSISWELK